ncbi:MAG TPA: ATP phosphoribosyltransferase regulatory subunit, partial [bacterium]|nr:ATP phosphoribosyltransferase regulatory subunit [bacterium]
IDKLDKQPWATIKSELETFDMDRGTFLILSTFIETALANRELWFSDEKIKNSPEVGEIEEICKSVKAVNPAANVVFDPLLVRGFDYYTGPVFEINVEDKDFAFSIGGGGRYDGLIEKLGGPKNTPAVGLSLGFERILTILMEKEGGVSKTLQQRVYIVNDGKSEKDIHVLAESLRSHEIAVETGLEKKDKVKQLVAAQGNGLEYAITDFVPGVATFKVRQLSNRQDTEMTAEQLKVALQKLL